MNAESPDGRVASGGKRQAGRVRGQAQAAGGRGQAQAAGGRQPAGSPQACRNN